MTCLISYAFRTPDVGYTSLRPDGYRNINDHSDPTSFDSSRSSHQASLQNNFQPLRPVFQNPQLLASPPPPRVGGIIPWQGYDQRAQQQRVQQQHTPYRPILPAYDQNGQHQGLHNNTVHNQVSALHALLMPSSPTSSPMSSMQRRQLITQNIYQLRGLGRLNERSFYLNGQYLSSLELFVQASAPGASPGSHVSAKEIYEFCKVCATFVQMGADTGRIVPHGFAHTISNAAKSNNAILNQPLQQDGSPTFSLWTTVWISACQQSLSRNFVSLDEHFVVLSYHLGVDIDVHQNLRRLFLESSSPNPYTTPESTTKTFQNLWDQ